MVVWIAYKVIKTNANDCFGSKRKQKKVEKNCAGSESRKISFVSISFIPTWGYRVDDDDDDGLFSLKYNKKNIHKLFVI